MSRGLNLVGLLAAAVAVAGGAQAAVAQAAVTERVSISSAGAQGNDISGRLSRPDVNADGRFVTFDSQANNLVANDTNGKTVDVFVRDRRTKKTELVSVNSRERQGTSSSSAPVISADGRYIAFSSNAVLVADDTNQVADVYLRDRQAGTTVRVSVAADGTQGDASSFGPAMSADGRYVAFVSDATNLVPGKTMFPRDVYVKDVQTGAIEVASLADDESEGNSSAAPPDISADGRFVAFGSFASNMVPNDGNDAFDVFVRDLQLDTTERVSVSSAEVEGDAASFKPAINADGRYVAYSSEADNLVPMDLNQTRDIFLRDRQAGTTERISVSSSEAEGNKQSDGPGIRGGTSFGPDIDAAGRLVVFDSIATNLVPGDTNTCEPFYQDPPGVCPDVFVRDRVAGTTTRLSVATDGTQGNRASTDPAINSTGLVSAFFSSASNLVPGDTNICPVFPQPGSCPDIFVSDSRARPVLG
jgi:Tol biopolymer transport system component